MRAVIVLVILCLACGIGIGCEKTIKDVRNNGSEGALASSNK
jgi:hypothetical protein